MKSHAQNRAELVSLVSSGTRVKYLFFWGHTVHRDGTLGNECFSQWYPSAFEVDGHIYPTAEHFMMAEKARLFGDEQHRSLVFTATTPAEAKAIGRRVVGFVDDVWKAARSEIVVAGNLAKFGQKPELRDHLLATGMRVLVEAAPRDRIWGIGLGAKNPKAENPLEWRGLNLLGFALMEVRAQLRQSAE